MSQPVEITLEWACPACGSYEIEVCTYTWPNKPKQKPPVWATCHECGANGPAEEFLRPATEEEEEEEEEGSDEQAKIIEVWECPVCGNHEIDIATYTRAGRPEQGSFVWAKCLGCGGKGPVEDFLVYAEEVCDDSDSR